MKRYIWGFPGVGKSNLSIPGFKIVDADSRLFEFKNSSLDDLHGAAEPRRFERDSSYPNNYLNYIKTVDADIVLINCHITLLDHLKNNDVLVVYPSKELLNEYIERYSARGDNISFISYMAAEAPGMIDYIESTGHEKYKVLTSNTYLSDLFERNDFKMKVMTRAELIAQLQRAMDLGVVDTVYDGNKASLVCDLKFAKDYPPKRRIENAEIWAVSVLDGKYELDIDQLQKVCAQREAEIEKEKVFAERRGGLSREELEDKIMQGIVNGALGVKYGQIAPYSHGYEVTFGGGWKKGSTWKYDNRWECYNCGFFDIPGEIVEKIEKGYQCGRVFGDDVKPFDISKMLVAIDEMENNQISSFVPAQDSGFKRRRSYDGHVASVEDVHNGLAFDGIVQHYYHGDYSSMTPGNQNDLVENLVFMKGFCLDCLDYAPSRRADIVAYLNKRGIDISTPEKLQQWIKANPEKCGKEENRKLSLDEQIKKGNAQRSNSSIFDTPIDREER